MADLDGQNDWERTWRERQAALERILGEAEDTVYHATVPFLLGGNADVLVFHNHLNGVVYVTADLTGSDSEQKPCSAGQYELGICTRDEAKWAANLISRLSRYTLDAELDFSHTMDCPLFGDSEIKALLFTNLDPVRSRFTVDGEPCTILLCVGITAQELELSRKHGSAELVTRLKEAGVFPFTDIGRHSVC